MKIDSILARQILDSRGNPTIEVEIVIDSFGMGRASVPSGASTGSREAIELRDEGDEYGGQGVLEALNNVIEILTPALIGKEISSQLELDKLMCELDGTPNKSRLGANAILAVSLAYAKAKAVAQNKPLYLTMAELSSNSSLHLPTPMFNIINGGKHAINSADFQEFMVVPKGITDYREALRAGTEVFHSLGKLLVKGGNSTAVGDEGGYSMPPQSKNTDALDLIVSAISSAGYQPGKDIFIALDVAASELFESGSYNLKTEKKSLSSSELINYYQVLVKNYPIISIEDGLDESDWSNWTELNSKLSQDIMLVGDDLLVTNTKYIQQAIDTKACNAVLIKPNQIGTLSETIAAVELAHKNGLTTIMSHRSGETEDTTIAQLAVGLGCKFIKSGSLSRTERLAKYNELLRIGEKLPNSFKL